MYSLRKLHVSVLKKLPGYLLEGENKYQERGGCGIHKLESHPQNQKKFYLRMIVIEPRMKFV